MGLSEQPTEDRTSEEAGIVFGRRSWPIFIVALLPWGVFGWSLFFDFLHYDDDVLLSQNRRVVAPALSDIPEIWTSAPLGIYMPLTETVWSAVGALHRVFEPESDLPAWPFHGLNLILASWLGVMTCRLLQKTGLPMIAAAMGSVLTIVHPVSVESICWASEAKGLLSAALAMTSLDRYVDPLRRARGSTYAWSIVFFLLALLAKPSAVVVPALALVIDVVACRRPVIAALVRSLPMLVLSVAWLVLTRRVQGSYIDDGILLIDRLAVVADAYLFYLDKLLVPIGLGPDYGRYPAAVLTGEVSRLPWWRVLMLAGFLFALPAAIWKTRLFLTAHLLFLNGLLPTLGLIPFAFQSISTVADRYMFLALIGPAYALGMFARNRSPLRVALVSLILLLLSVTSVRQSSFWENDRALIERAVAVNPRSFTFLSNRSALNINEGNLSQAIEDARRALSIQPDHTAGRLNLAAVLAKSGDHAQAVRVLHEGLKHQPEEIRWIDQLVKLHMMKEEFGEALVLARLLEEKGVPQADRLVASLMILAGYEKEGLDKFRVLLADPLATPEDQLLVAQVHEQADSLEEAIRRLRMILDRFGGIPKVKVKLAKLLATASSPELRKPTEALQLLLPLTQGSGSGSLELWDIVAMAQAASGQFDKAIDSADRAIAIANKLGNNTAARVIERRRVLYQQGKPYIESAQQP